MSAPVIISATPSQPSYTPGAQIRITIKYTPGQGGEAKTVTTTVTGTNTATGEPATVTVSFTTGGSGPAPVNWTATDTDGRFYLLESDDGTGTAVLTAVA